MILTYITNMILVGLQGHSSVRIAKPYEIRNTEESKVLHEEW